ncbi:hypothetical protein ACKVWC_005654 [Pyricularia oryzae]
MPSFHLRSPLGLAFTFGFLFLSLSGQQVPDDQFSRRGNHVAAVLGDYLYVEGGEIARLVDGEVDKPNPTRPVNSTFSIPLNVAWTNKTVVFKETPVENEASMDHASVWTNDDGSGGSGTKMYLWGGERAYEAVTDEARNPRLRVFTADGRGGGSWGHEEVPNLDFVVRTAGGAGVGCGGFGLSLGGWSNKRSDFRVRHDGSMPVPGLVTHRITSSSQQPQPWGNESAPMHPPFGTLKMGRAVCLPTVGGDDGKATGLAVFMGGSALSRDSTQGAAAVLFNTVTMYDPTRRRWHSQVSTGQVPPPRMRFCTTAARSAATGTYEIFVYGGGSTLGLDEEQPYSDLHVLTVPGFRWFRVDLGTADDSIHKRQDLSCTAVPGTRLMISVGGWENSRDSKTWSRPDPWTKGIGVFDMTALRWVDRYDPAAGEYESPKMVRDWYQSRGLASVEWSSEETKQLFSSMLVQDSATTGGTGDDASNNNGGTQKDGNDSNNSSTNNTLPAIIGGTAGGVALVVLAGLLFVLIRRRRRQQQRQVEPASSGSSDFGGEWKQAPEQASLATSQELASLTRPQEVASAPKTQEMCAVSYMHEMEAKQIQEVEGSGVVHELDAARGGGDTAWRQ